jgi:hypothetical protein
MIVIIPSVLESYSNTSYYQTALSPESVRPPVLSSTITSSYLESTTRSTLTWIYSTVNTKVTSVNGKLHTGCPCLRSPALSWRGSNRVYGFVNISLNCSGHGLTENPYCECAVLGAFMESSGKTTGRERLSSRLYCLPFLICCLALSL